MSQHACACCGYLTLSEPTGIGSFEICSICGWEDDNVQYADPSYAGGANKPSLKDAQKNFQQFGKHDQNAEAYTRKPTAGDKKDPNWKPLP